LETLSSFIKNHIFPASKYGPFICVPVIEKTANAKAKVVAIKELHRCVEICGLDGIGKRGLTSTAKVLSEEHVSEIKIALLDLIETVILKMDSDIQKYLKICTSSYLSSKARDLILERISRHGIGRGHAENSHPSISQDRPTKSSVSNETADNMSGLKLNLGLRASTQVSVTEYAATPDGPFTFSFQSKFSPMTNVEDKTRVMSASYASTPLSARGSMIPDPLAHRTHHQISNTSSNDTSAAGAAASLRERLKQIRDKHRLGSQTAVTSIDIDKDEGYVDSPPVKKDSSLISSVITVPPVIQRTPPSFTEKTMFSGIIECVDKLLFEPIPLIPNNSRYFTTALDGLRRIHASLTSTQSGAANQAAELEQLKSQIITNMAVCVERLARYEYKYMIHHVCLNPFSYISFYLHSNVFIVVSVLDFGFKCCHSDQTAGLSIPLLSVGIAALMAIFLDMDLAAHVSQSSLIHVLREASKGLLDPRLNATTPTDYPDLDDATCKKMAKAMNKVMIDPFVTSSQILHISIQTHTMHFYETFF